MPLADDAAEEIQVAIVQKPQSGALLVEKAKQPTQVPPARGSAPTTEQIAARAYEIRLASGSPQGHDQEHWLQAERELRSGKPLRH